VPYADQENSLPQGISQRIFLLAGLILADSAKNLQFSSLNQGRLQGFQGISWLSLLLTMTYERFTAHNASPNSELAGTSGPDCAVRSFGKP
jgi:hypothetical protein